MVEYPYPKMGVKLLMDEKTSRRNLIMYLKRYKPDEPEYDRICEELRVRRAQMKA